MQTCSETDFKCGTQSALPIVWNYTTRSFPFSRHLFYCSDTRIVEHFFVIEYFSLSVVPTYLLNTECLTKLYCPKTEHDVALYLPLPHACPTTSATCELASSLSRRCSQNRPQAVLLLRARPNNIEQFCVAFLDSRERGPLMARMLLSADELRPLAHIICQTEILDPISSVSAEYAACSSAPTPIDSNFQVSVSSSSTTTLAKHLLQGVLRSAVNTFFCLDPPPVIENIQLSTADKEVKRESAASKGIVAYFVNLFFIHRYHLCYVAVLQLLWLN